MWEKFKKYQFDFGNIPFDADESFFLKQHQKIIKCMVLTVFFVLFLVANIVI